MPRPSVRSRVRPARGLVAALTVLLVSAGCGGGGSSSPSPSPSPSPLPGTSTSQNPCSAALQSEDVEFELQVSREEPRPRRKVVDGLHRGRLTVDDLIWSHRSRAGVARAAGDDISAPARTEDVGDIAVIEDDGTILTKANAFDLKGTGLRFRPTGTSTVEVTKIDGAFRASLGSRLNLGDDDSSRVAVSSAITFAGKRYDTAFVNSDGNITFEEADTSSSARSVGRLVSGPPRVAAFFSDLDPSAGGRVFSNPSAEGLTVTWCSVPAFESSDVVTVQATVLVDGSVELKFGDTFTLSDGVVGVGPGRGATFAPVDLSVGASTGPAVGETFARDSELDEVALAQQFYRTHGDDFQQLVIVGDSALIARNDGFAFEVTIANVVRGIGQGIFNLAREFGSAARLESVVNLDRLAKYPDDPRATVLGENSTLSVMGQEVGHRWLAYLQFRDVNGKRSGELLGRDDAHWSFFFDSDASVMEGNDIADLGGGSFRTTGTVQRYSLLDQYAMGLVGPTQVPKFFYVESPTNVQPPRERDAAPRTGVTFNGTRRDVLIDDVIAEMGSRVPASADASKTFRQAYVYVVARGRTAPAEEVAKLDRIRREFQAFFSQATDGRMTLDTRLR